MWVEHNYEPTRPVDPRMNVEVKYRNGRVGTGQAETFDWERVKVYREMGYDD